MARIFQIFKAITRLRYNRICENDLKYLYYKIVFGITMQVRAFRSLIVLKLV
jgi:hypothetical protein